MWIRLTATMGRELSIPSPATGIVNGAQVFNSANNTQINVPADNSFNWQSNESFSIEFWMKTDGFAPVKDQVIIGRDDMPVTGLQWWVGVHNTDGLVSFFLRETNGIGSDLSGVGTISLADGSWHHVVAVRDESTNDNIVYVDGVEQGRVNHNYVTRFGSATAELNIGWLDAETGFHFDGLIDEVALYDRALPQTEIQEHHDAGRLGKGVDTLRPEPIADAGDDQTVNESTEVTLDGSNSSDADGAIVSHRWEQADGTAVTLTTVPPDKATFTAPDVAAAGETLTFQLTVTDEDGQASMDTISVNVSDSTSAAAAGGGSGGGCFITTIF